MTSYAIDLAYAVNTAFEEFESVEESLAYHIQDFIMTHCKDRLKRYSIRYRNFPQSSRKAYVEALTSLGMPFSVEFDRDDSGVMDVLYEDLSWDPDEKPMPDEPPKQLNLCMLTAVIGATAGVVGLGFLAVSALEWLGVL